MNKAFEKILKKIEEKRNKYQRLADGSNFDGWHEEYIKYSEKAEMCEELKEIVQEVSKEYNGGWIACSERLPEESLNSVIGWDEYRQRCCFVHYYGGRWILGNDIDSVKIIAWKPLPEPFKERD